MTLGGASIGFFFGVRRQSEAPTALGFVGKSNCQVASAKAAKIVGNRGKKFNSTTRPCL